jgi:acetyl-CoA synthetase
VTAGKPGSAMKGPAGVSALVVDDEGNAVKPARRLPRAHRAVAGHAAHDLGRRRAYQETYWSRFKGKYFAGDGAKLDEDGDIWLLGRGDDVMNVSGHRLSTTEIESALVSHPKRRRGSGRRRQRRRHRSGGERLRDPARVGTVDGGDGRRGLIAELRNHVSKEIGPIAKPKSILVVSELPKTRSGKIMRRAAARRGREA